MLPLAVAAAAVGAWASGTLLAEHAGGWGDAAGGSSFLLQFCESESVPGGRCADALASRWGSFDVTVAGRQVVVPAALLGLGYFVAVGLWLVLLGTRGITADAWLRRLTVVGLTFGLLASIGFAGVMIFSLQQWCPLCGVAHAANLILFVAGLGICFGWGESRGGRAQENAFARGLQTACTLSAWRHRQGMTAVAAIGLALAGLWFYYDTNMETRRQWRKAYALKQAFAELENDPDFVLREFFAQPVVDAALGEGASSSTGDAEPRVVVFSDFLCRACNCFEVRWSDVLLPALTGRAQVEYRHLPRLADDGTDAAASAPARAAVAAYLQGGREAEDNMRWLLFARRKLWPDLPYEELAERAGLNGAQLRRDMQSEAVSRRIEQDRELANVLGVTELPAVYLNGRRVPDLCLRSEVFWSRVGDALAALAPEQSNTEAEVYASSGASHVD